MVTLRTLTPDEVADILRKPRKVVYRLLAQGVLPGVKLGRSWRIPEEALRHRLGLDSGSKPGNAEK